MKRLLASLLLIASAACAFAQDRGQLTLPNLGSDVRSTNPDFNVTFLPEWHAENDTNNPPPAGFTYNTGVAITATDLRNFTSPQAGYLGTGTIVVTVQTGTLPTGITLVGSVLSGTPTVDNGDVTFRATMDGIGAQIADQTFAFTLQGTDTTAPDPPGDLECSPDPVTPASAITCTWTTVPDASEPVVYPVRYAGTQILCNSSLNGDNTFLETSTDGTATISGLGASQTIWVKARSEDDANNQGAWAVCVSGTTTSGGGGGGSGMIFSDEFDSGSVPNSQFWGDSTNVAGTGSCTRTVTGGYHKIVLVANPTGNDKGGGSYRCESPIKVFLAGDTTDGIDGLIEAGDTVYYGFAIRMPSATAYDSVKGDTLNQIFQNIGNGDGCHEAIVIENNQIKWKTQDCVRTQSQLTILSPLAKDTWVNICQVYKWEQNGTGFHKLWVNPSSEASTPVINYSGQTLMNDIAGTPDPEPYYVGKFKIGDYKTGWRTSQTAANQEAMSPREFHHGYVRIADNFEAACGDPL